MTAKAPIVDVLMGLTASHSDVQVTFMIFSPAQLNARALKDINDTHLVLGKMKVEHSSRYHFTV